MVYQHNEETGRMEYVYVDDVTNQVATDEGRQWYLDTMEEIQNSGPMTLQLLIAELANIKHPENEPTSAPGHLDANQGCSTTSVDDSNVITK